METACGPRTRTIGELARAEPWLWIGGGLLAALLGREVADMAAAWQSVPESSHGFLVLPAFAYLVWRKREHLAALPARPYAMAGVAAAASFALFCVGKQSGLASFYRAAVVLIAWSYVLWVFGPALVKRIAWPLLLLAFLIPPPHVFLATVSVPLRSAATEASCAIAAFFGAPLAFSGTTIRLPAGILEIEAACSGLRGAITLALIALFLGELREATAARRIGLVGLALLFAFVLNIARVVATIALVCAFGLAAATSAFHELSGLVIIAAGAAGLAAFARGRGREAEAAP